MQQYKPLDLTTKTRIAKHAGISVDAVSKWNLKPVSTKGRVNYYYQGDVYKKLREINARLTSSFDYERTRKEKELADKLEMENAVRRNELAPVELLADALQLVAGQIRSILGGIPSQCRKRLPHLTAREIQIIQKEVVKAQNTASEIQLTDKQLN